jgi:hypothetical protein
MHISFAIKALKTFNRFPFDNGKHLNMFETIGPSIYDCRGKDQRS